MDYKNGNASDWIIRDMRKKNKIGEKKLKKRWS